MGDLFHDSSTQQTANNSQVGVSNRDVGGSVITAGNGARVNVQSLDPAALAVAANAVHDAIASNTATSVSAFQAFQSALSVTGETAGGALQVASSGAGGGAPIITGSASSINPSTVIWLALAGVGTVLVLGWIKSRS